MGPVQSSRGKAAEHCDVHVFMGKKLLSLQAGDEITSQYTLPARSKPFLFCHVRHYRRYYHEMKNYPDDEMKVSVYVEDEKAMKSGALRNTGTGQW